MWLSVSGSEVLPLVTAFARRVSEPTETHTITAVFSTSIVAHTTAGEQAGLRNPLCLSDMNRDSSRSRCTSQRTIVYSRITSTKGGKRQEPEERLCVKRKYRDDAVHVLVLGPVDRAAF